MKPDDGKTLSRLNKQVNQTTELSEILAGTKPIGGKIGKKIENLKEKETSVKKGKEIRDKNFKTFDKYLERMELIANLGTPGVEKVKIKRAIIKDPKDPNKDKLI